MKRYFSIAVLLIGFYITACSNQAEVPNTHGVYMLIDTSGTYTEELDQAQRIINFTLSKMNPGDTFAVARVDTGSFSEKDIIYLTTFSNLERLINLLNLPSPVRILISLVAFCRPLSILMRRILAGKPFSSFLTSKKNCEKDSSGTSRYN